MTAQQESKDIKAEDITQYLDSRDDFDLELFAFRTLRAHGWFAELAVPMSTQCSGSRGSMTCAHVSAFPKESSASFISQSSARASRKKTLWSYRASPALFAKACTT